ncbi:MAG: prolipoprotein diacylglyceryl transferase [Fibrobacterota bacterium]
MLQTLFSIGHFQLHTYGLMLALGFLLGIAVGTRRARATAVDPTFISDLAVVVILSAILGARLFYVALNWEEFRGNLLSIINPVQPDGTLGIGGLVFLGGLVLSFITTLLYTRYRKQPLLEVLDVSMPPLAFGMAVGRIGCFLNGCCYGLPAALPWAFSFPADCPAGAYQAAMQVHALHPAQLYMVLGDLLMGLLLILLERYKRFTGFTTLLFFMFYAVDRSVVDLFRYYPTNELHHGLTHNQIALGILFITSATIFMVAWKRSRVRA